LRDMADYVRQHLAGAGQLTDEQALARFGALPVPVQLAAPFMPQLRQAFYDLLRQSGREAIALGNDYSRGFNAIGTLSPGAGRQGDVSLLCSQTRTESGGSISLLVPGGGVNAGQTTPPADAGSSKSADELGIVVQDSGAMRAFSLGSFAVNESRVFTL